MHLADGEIEVVIALQCQREMIDLKFSEHISMKLGAELPTGCAIWAEFQSPGGNEGNFDQDWREAKVFDQTDP